MITSVVAQPRLAAIHASGDRTALAAFFAIARRWTLLASLAAASILAIGGKLILGLFGPDYVAAYPALLVLLAGHAAAAAFGPITSLLVLIDRQHSAAFILGLATLLNAILTMLLARPFGAAGAAFASSLSLVGSYCALFFLVKDQFNEETVS
jgi:O-antigen/teichoic acid export membrane protein